MMNGLVGASTEVCSWVRVIDGGGSYGVEGVMAVGVLLKGDKMVDYGRTGRYNGCRGFYEPKNRRGEPFCSLEDEFILFLNL